jgi:hypothetical protein
VNFDSLTEIDASVARNYVQEIVSRCETFVSVNHEFNAPRVQDIMQDCAPQVRGIRYPYWMRTGYAEEIYSF